MGAENGPRTMKSRKQIENQNPSTIFSRYPVSSPEFLPVIIFLVAIDVAAMMISSLSNCRYVLPSLEQAMCQHLKSLHPHRDIFLSICFYIIYFILSRTVAEKTEPFFQNLLPLMTQNTPCIVFGWAQNASTRNYQKFTYILILYERKENSGEPLQKFLIKLLRYEKNKSL